jgi:hypothetical protein
LSDVGKVTYSRLGISLRRRGSKNETGLLLARAATRVPNAAANTPRFSICLQYRGGEQRTELPLTPAMVSQLALEASARGQKISELARDLVQVVTEMGPFDKVLEE